MGDYCSAVLTALSDRALRDIGLARGDLHYVAETGIDPRPRAVNDNPEFAMVLWSAGPAGPPVRK